MFPPYSQRIPIFLLLLHTTALPSTKMPRGKNTPTIVVRPIAHGARKSTKTVLGTMSQLNRHAPCVSSTASRPASPSSILPRAPFLGSRPLPACECNRWCERALTPSSPFPFAERAVDVQDEVAAHLKVWEDRKPWQRPSHFPDPTRPPPASRNAGRNAARRHGAGPRQWVSRAFVSGAAYEPDWTYDSNAGCSSDVEEEWETEDARWNENEAEDARDERIEVDIMAIAKPAKPRGERKKCGQAPHLSARSLQALRRSTSSSRLCGG